MNTLSPRGGVILFFLVFSSVVVSAGDAVRVRVKVSTNDSLPTVIAPHLWRSDAAGNTVALGATLDTTGDDENMPDIRVVKLGADGLPIWNTFFGTSNRIESGWDLQLDARGNVYVTGYANNERDVNEGVTLKYNSAGTALWTNRFNGPDEDTIGRLIAVDTNGNAAVLFYARAGVIVVKLNSDGTVAWQHNLGVPAGLQPAPFYGPESGFALACDPDGNVLASVSVARNETNGTPVVLTLKWNPDGLPLWTNRFEESVDGQVGVIPQSITTDRNGNIFVATFSGKLLQTGINQSGIQRLAIVSYQPDGKLRWTSHLDLKDTLVFYITPNELATDRQGAVYITGASAPSPEAGEVVQTAKFNTHGHLVWRKKTRLVDLTTFGIRFQRITPNRVTLYLDETLDGPLGGPLPRRRTEVNYIQGH